MIHAVAQNAVVVKKDLLKTWGKKNSVDLVALGIEQGALVPGQRAALLGIGSGINSLMLGIDW